MACSTWHSSQCCRGTCRRKNATKNAGQVNEPADDVQGAAQSAADAVNAVAGENEVFNILMRGNGNVTLKELGGEAAMAADPQAVLANLEAIKANPDKFNQLSEKQKQNLEDLIKEARAVVSAPEAPANHVAVETTAHQQAPAVVTEAQQKTIAQAVQTNIKNSDQMGVAPTSEQVAAVKDVAKQEGLAADADIQAALEGASAALRTERESFTGEEDGTQDRYREERDA